MGSSPISAAVQCGASAYALGRNATERDAELVDLLFSSVGFCIRGEAYLYLGCFGCLPR